MTTLSAGWKLVPIEPTREMWAAVNKLDDEMAAGAYDGKGASIEQVWNCLVDAAPNPPATTPDAPITVSLDPDPRGVSVGVWQGSRRIYTGAHVVPVAQDDAKDYGSPADVAHRIEQYLAHDGRENSATLLLYEAMKALRAPAAGDARDAERLDFLANHGAHVAWSKDRECCAVFLRDNEGNSGPMTKWGENWLTAREAIDAAIAAQQGKGGEA